MLPLLRSRLETAARVILIAVILFNATIPTSVLAKSVERPGNNNPSPISLFTRLKASIGKLINHPDKQNTIHLVTVNLDAGTPWGYWNLNEGSATSAADLGTGANNGTINGTAVWANGRYYDPNSQPPDYALQFNGSNTYINVPDTFSPMAYTIALWLQPTTLNSNIFVRTNSNGPIAQGFFCKLSHIFPC